MAWRTSANRALPSTLPTAIFRRRAARFIVADTPGHESYTRNTASGASNADLAIILVDARRGLLPQTRRHAMIAHMVGVRHFVLAVNKLDLVNWDRTVYDRIVEGFRDFAKPLNFASLVPIPLSALTGDNVSSASPTRPGMTDRACSDIWKRSTSKPTNRQRRCACSCKTCCGPTATAGSTPASSPAAHCAKAIPSRSPSGVSGKITRIVVAGEERDRANTGESVAIGLDRHIDVTRGDTLVAPDRRPQVTDQFEAHLIWMSEQPLLPGREYILKVGVRSVSASVTGVKHRVDIETLHREPVHTLALNEIGICDIATAVSPCARQLY